MFPPFFLPVVSPRCVSPMCLPVVSPQGGDPNAKSRGERFAPTRARQNQAGNAHIDGATPSYLPTSINQPNQNMPHRSELSQDRRQNRHLCPKKDNSDVFPGGFASCLGITLMSFLVVLPPVLGQL